MQKNQILLNLIKQMTRTKKIDVSVKSAASDDFEIIMNQFNSVYDLKGKDKLITLDNKLRTQTFNFQRFLDSLLVTEPFKNPEIRDPVYAASQMFIGIANDWGDLYIRLINDVENKNMQILALQEKITSMEKEIKSKKEILKLSMDASNDMTTKLEKLLNSFENSKAMLLKPDEMNSIKNKKSWALRLGNQNIDNLLKLVKGESAQVVARDRIALILLTQFDFKVKDILQIKVLDVKNIYNLKEKETTELSFSNEKDGKPIKILMSSDTQKIINAYDKEFNLIFLSAGEDEQKQFLNLSKEHVNRKYKEYFKELHALTNNVSNFQNAPSDLTQNQLNNEIKAENTTNMDKTNVIIDNGGEN